MELIDMSEWTEESAIIQVHTLIALAGLGAGLFAMFAAKGTPCHKTMGRIFVGLAGATALTSFFIHEIRLWGPFSYIHLLSIFTLFLIYRGIRAIRAGDVIAHQNAMRFLFLSGFVVAGGFTLKPDRMPYEILLERGLERLAGSDAGAEALAWVFPIATSLIALWIYLRGYKRRAP